MTVEQFNSLPLEARSFIENHAGCLPCGNKEAKLDKAYNLYKQSKIMNGYSIMGGAINFEQKGVRGVLNNVSLTDTPDEIRRKIEVARAIHEKAPHHFMSFDEVAIEAILKELPAEEVVALDDEAPKRNSKGHFEKKKKEDETDLL